MYKVFIIFLLFSGLSSAKTNKELCKDSFKPLKSNLEKIFDDNPTLFTKKDKTALLLIEKLVQTYGIKSARKLEETLNQILDRIKNNDLKPGDLEFKEVNLKVLEKISFQNFGGWRYVLLYPSYEQAQYVLRGIRDITTLREYEYAVQKNLYPELQNFPVRAEVAYGNGRGWKTNDERASEDYLGDRFSKQYANSIGEIAQIVVDLKLQSAWDLLKRREQAVKNQKAGITKEEDIKALMIHGKHWKFYDFGKYESLPRLIIMIINKEIEVTPEFIAQESANIIVGKEKELSYGQTSIWGDTFPVRMPPQMREASQAETTSARDLNPDSKRNDKLEPKDLEVSKPVETTKPVETSKPPEPPPVETEKIDTNRYVNVIEAMEIIEKDGRITEENFVEIWSLDPNLQRRVPKNPESFYKKIGEWPGSQIFFGFQSIRTRQLLEWIIDNKVKSLEDFKVKVKEAKKSKENLGITIDVEKSLDLKAYKGLKGLINQAVKNPEKILEEVITRDNEVRELIEIIKKYGIKSEFDYRSRHSSNIYRGIMINPPPEIKELEKFPKNLEEAFVKNELEEIKRAMAKEEFLKKIKEMREGVGRSELEKEDLEEDF